MSFYSLYTYDYIYPQSIYLVPRVSFNFLVKEKVKMIAKQQEEIFRREEMKKAKSGTMKSRGEGGPPTGGVRILPPSPITVMQEEVASPTLPGISNMQCKKLLTLNRNNIAPFIRNVCGQNLSLKFLIFCFSIIIQSKHRIYINLQGIEAVLVSIYF